MANGRLQAHVFFPPFYRSSHGGGKGETCKDQKENEEKGISLEFVWFCIFLSCFAGGVSSSLWFLLFIIQARMKRREDTKIKKMKAEKKKSKVKT